MRHTIAMLMVLLILFLDGCDSLNCSEGYLTCSRSAEGIPLNYNAMDIPTINASEPLQVNVTLWLESIGKIDVSSMEMEVIGYLSQEWKDERLSHPGGHTVIYRDDSLLWSPDVYCANCRKSSIGSKDGSQRSLLRVEPTGSVYYSIGVKLTSSCYMQLQQFPFDRQICSLQFLSYSYNTSYLMYRWDGPVVLEFKNLAQFKVNSIITEIHIVDYKAGNFSRLVSKIEFVRRIGYYIVQVYMPTGMLVCLSWILFFMHPNHIGDRLAIGITLILTMIFLLGYINGSLPKVSYIKSVDWYLFGSLAMIILSVIECVVIYWLFHRMGAEGNHDTQQTKEEVEEGQVSRKSKRKSLRMSSMRNKRKLAKEGVSSLVQSIHTDSNPWSTVPIMSENNCEEKTPNNSLKRKRSTWPLYRQLDVYCRILFPLTYFILNFIYWYY